MKNQEIDNGLELLKKVIKSNEENIENITKINLVYDDILNLIGEFESSARVINYRIRNLEKNIDEIPKKIEINLSEESISILDNFEKNLRLFQKLFVGSIVSLILAVLIMILVFLKN